MSDLTDVEEWRPIPGFSARYEASSNGRIRSKRRLHIRGGIRSATSSNGGYPVLSVVDDEDRVSFQQVHRLVALTFLGPCPQGHEVRHLDGDPWNAAARNLAYGTASENRMDSVRHGTHANAAKTHCPEGHPYDEENTYRPPSTPTSRQCKACVRKRANARWKRIKAARLTDVTPVGRGVEWGRR